MDTWESYVAAVGSGLGRLAITDRHGQLLGSAEGFTRWVEITREVHGGGRSIFLVGNGASAAMASHFAADACKNGGLRAQAFNDAALLTCAGNDLAFDQIFALPLSRFARPGDMLISISSSGASPNVIRALEHARDMQLRIITLSGRRSDNPSRAFGEVNVYMPCDRYGWVESGHHVILHYWLDQYMNLHGQGAV
ncbi:MAG TPA: SIS domain-containing protein [Vicinamibacterales bacterium]|jgi:D-sedoheptulose 7-phosphate isomerase|nr:SIS domain-containing protein [Vicinamibacterales bacterium]